MSRDRELGSPEGEMIVTSERLRAVLDQTPTAVLVTLVNAALMAVLLEMVEPKQGLFEWLGVAIIVAVARLCLWWSYRHDRQPLSHYRIWSKASVCSAFAAGLVWGVGSVLLLPASQQYQLFWVFLIGGMSAGAASLHYPHWPTAACFIIPACVPLAIRFGLDRSEAHVIAAAMIVIFVVALGVTSLRASRNFGEKLQLQHALVKRTRELDALNEKLRNEMAEHKATAATLQHAQKMEAVGRLTGALAHDFNNLLMVVLGNLTLLRNRVPAEDARAAGLLEMAVQGAERGATLTQRLLAFGRRQALVPKIADLPILVHNVAPLLGSALGDKVSLSIHFPAVLPAVEVDPNQLELALLNLAANSRDAMPQGGTFSIKAYAQQESSTVSGSPRPGSYVVLTVSDTGTGMDNATLARATEPFFTTKGIGKGTGLGLSMVYGFAAQSGGQLILRSKTGDGTVAELWLPCAQHGPQRSLCPLSSCRCSEPGVVQCFW